MRTKGHIRGKWFRDVANVSRGAVSKGGATPLLPPHGPGLATGLDSTHISASLLRQRPQLWQPTTPSIKCPSEATSAVDELEVEAAEVEEIIEEVAEAEEVERKGKQRNRRKKTSWTCRNIWTSRSTSNSMGGEKVSLPHANHALANQLTFYIQS